MQSIYRRSTQKLFTDQSLSIRSVYPLYSSGFGFDESRFYSANVTEKGSGHLVRKGTDGRSSVSGIAANVFGATGFLGRQQLAKMGAPELVPFRGSDDFNRHLKYMGGLGQIMGDRMILHRRFSSNAGGKPTEFPAAVKEEAEKTAKTPAKPIMSFSPLEAVSVKPRTSGLGNESVKIKRTELVDKITFALIPALILTSKGSLTTSVLVLSVYWQVYGFFKEIFLDYVHQEVTRKWVLIYFQILLLILAKDTLLNFGLV